MTDLNKENSRSPDNFSEKVKQRAERKLKARQQKSHSAWFGLGMFGLVGWSIAVPALAGIILGLWLDQRWPSDTSWTLTLLIIGVVIGCLNAWYWIKQESRHD